MIDGHVLRGGEAVMDLDRVHLRQVRDPGAGAGVLDGAMHLREDIGLIATGLDLAGVADRSRAMAPALDPREALERNAPLVGIGPRPTLGGQKHHGRAVGHLAAVLLAGAALDHGIGRVVVREGLGRKPPVAGLGVGIAAAVGEVVPRDRHQVLVVQPVTAVVLVGQVGEGPGPQEAGVLELLADPRGRAQVLGGLLAWDIAHLLDADHAGQIVAASLDLGGGRQDRHATGGAGRLVARGRQAVQSGMDEAKEPAQQPLAREQLSGEITDMTRVDVLGIQIDGGQTLADRLREGIGQRHALSRPIGREIALPSAEDVDHGRPTPTLAVMAAGCPRP